jgi:hypothetical protein
MEECGGRKEMEKEGRKRRKGGQENSEEWKVVMVVDDDDDICGVGAACSCRLAMPRVLKADNCNAGSFQLTVPLIL